MFLGKAISFIAGGALTVATTYLVWQITDGGALPTAAVITIQFIPTILFGPFLGGQVDRWDRRRAMLVQQVLGALVAASLAGVALTGTAQLWNVYTLLFLSGILTAWSNPLQQAFLGEVLPKTNTAGLHPRKSGGSLNSLTWQSGNLVGAALAGILIPIWGVAGVMWLAPCAALAPIILIWCIRPHDRLTRSASAGTQRGGILEGVRHIRADPDVMAALLLGAAVGMIAMGTIQSGLQILVLSEFAANPDQEARVLGWVGVALAVGGILSQLLTGGGSYTPSGRLLLRIVTVLGGVLIAVAMAPWLWLVLVLAAVASLMAYAHQTAAQLINLHAPEHLQGRLSGLWFAAGSGGKAISSLLVGVLAELAGPRFGVAACGVLLVVAALLVGLLYRRVSAPGPVDSAAQHP
ncbi:MFS transporter [Nocardiopsis nanhaiensis]